MQSVADDIGACPFCGSVLVSVVPVQGEGLVDLLAVECNRCRARGPVVDGTRASGALARWNARAQSSSCER